MIVLFSRLSRNISIHAPARGASCILLPQKLPCKFQFTPLREGLPQSKVNSEVFRYFNSRPCERGFLIRRSWSSGGIVFQFTPLREGLLFHGLCRINQILFQFTPLREGLRCWKNLHVSISQFQFTPLREGLPYRRDQIPNQECISIHAPARGASEQRFRSWNCNRYFNSRPCERGFLDFLPDSKRC